MPSSVIGPIDFSETLWFLEHCQTKAKVVKSVPHPFQHIFINTLQNLILNMFSVYVSIEISSSKYIVDKWKIFDGNTTPRDLKYMYNISRFSGWIKKVLSTINLKKLILSLLLILNGCPMENLLRLSTKGAQRLTEYWNLHNWGSVGPGSVLQITVFLVCRFYNTQGGKLCLRVTSKAKEALYIINNSLY